MRRSQALGGHGQTGFRDIDERRVRLSEAGDPPESLNAPVSIEEQDAQSAWRNAAVLLHQHGPPRFQRGAAVPL